MLQVLFPLFKTHHKEIEDQAEKAKQSLKEKFGDFFKSEKKENGKEKENGYTQHKNCGHISGCGQNTFDIFSQDPKGGFIYMCNFRGSLAQSWKEAFVH